MQTIIVHRVVQHGASHHITSPAISISLIISSNGIHVRCTFQTDNNFTVKLWSCHTRNAIQCIHNYWVPVICSFGFFLCLHVSSSSWYGLFTFYVVRDRCKYVQWTRRIQQSQSQSQWKTKRWKIVIFVNRCTYSSERQNYKFPNISKMNK